MAKRIVEETLSNGEKRYCVQSNTLFGIPLWWSTMTITTDSGVLTSAVFSSLEKARAFLGRDRVVVSSKVIE
mgnify:FL=1